MSAPIATSHQSYSSSSAGAENQASSSSGREQATGVPKIVVFGGRGFVGSAVCQDALITGLQVLGVSRSGTPPPISAPWVKQVSWVRANALEPQSYAHLLQGAAAVISCVGAFGSQVEMLKLNGTANVKAIEAAAAAGVPRFVFISANIPNIPGIDYVIGGYIKGKRMTEASLQAHYPHSGVYLRPGAIYGPRVVSHSLTLPLQYAFGPLEALLGKLPNVKQLAALPVVGAAFVPPISVQAVARAAVRAATDPAVPAGPMEIWQMQEFR